METEGTHVIADVWLSGPLPDLWRSVVKYALTGVGNMTVLGELGHDFEPQGQTYVFLLAESHCAAHTYPEHNYVSFDIYGCGDGEPGLAMADILAQLPVEYAAVRHLRRGADDQGPKANAA